jgi:hypothetical protein
LLILEKNTGQRNHQDEAKADICLGAMEAFKSKDEFQKNNPKVQEKIAKLRDKNKWKTFRDVEARQTAKRQK